jgi:hypothetical protein
MRFTSSALALGLSLLSGVDAVITGFTVPATIAPGQPFVLTLNTASYSQAVYDVSAAFGIATGHGFPQSLGTVFGSKYLGPTDSNIEEPIVFTVQLPPTIEAGTGVLSVAVTSLWGVAASPAIIMYNVTVNIGSGTTTRDLVTSGTHV